MERDVKHWLISQLPINVVVQTQCKHLTKCVYIIFSMGYLSEKSWRQQTHNELMPIILQINYDIMLLLRGLSYVLN